MVDPHPVVEALADHSDMLATLTDIVDNHARRIEALERIDADNVRLGLEAAGIHEPDEQ